MLQIYILHQFLVHMHHNFDGLHIRARLTFSVRSKYSYCILLELTSWNNISDFLIRPEKVRSAHGQQFALCVVKWYSKWFYCICKHMQ